MSSRRTRSGTPLGCSSESRRLRQTPSRKQHQQRAAEETNVADKEAATGKSEHGHRDISEKKPVPSVPSRTDESPEKSASTLNIWERLQTVQNDSHAVAKNFAASYLEDRVSFVESEAKKTSAESSTTDTHKKGRKPEILLSLLEGESIVPTSARKVEDIDKGKDGETVVFSSLKTENSSTHEALDKKRCSLEERLSPFPLPQSICFFPNCDHVHETCADFSRIPEVPGEPFFVSLSKDKNKELNMVKTSSGMVRVGCGLRQFLPSTHVFSEPYVRDPVFPSQDPMVTCHQDRGGGTSICPLEAKVHVMRLDKSARLSKSKETHDGDVVCESDSRRAAIDEPCDWSPSGEHRDCVSDSDFSTDPSSFHALKSSVPSKSSQHRTMEEILTDAQHSTYNASATGGVSIHEMTAEELKMSKKTISLLKPPNAASHGALQSFPSATSMITTPSLGTILSSTVSSPVTSSDGECEKKGALKRSERIRCKSGASAVTVTQSVISTMKTSDSRSRLKSSMQRSKKKPKLTTSKENHKKKVSSGSKKSSFSKKSKDSSRSKVTMSREVMDAIVQSIEETVSRAREEKSSSSDQMSTSNSDYSSYDMSSSFSDSSKESSYWSERAYDKNGDRSTDDGNVALTPTGANPAHPSHKSVHIKSLKSKIVKKSCSKSKSSRRHSPGSGKRTKSSNSKKRDRSREGERSPEGEQELTQTLVTTMEGDGVTEKVNVTADGDVVTTVALHGKRFRKKTRKAEEAFGDYDVFCEEEMPVKKSKSKRRSSSSDSTGSNSQRRPRRSSQIGGLMADPVLEEHAFILWASENRSQLEVQHPGASTCEVDAMLSSRWCDVTDSVKSRFFFRAREAFSDDDRHMIRTSTISELESCALGDYFSDNDAVLIEFIRLPIDRQRELLRKWLRFFQKMLPKKEYVEFIVTFKRACGRDSTTANGKPKRTRMKCLDPSHYKMLFDMIRLAKPRILEIYREKKVKEKKMVTDTYSLMLHKLISNDSWPHTVTGCRSELLSEILQDLDIPEKPDSRLASPTCSSSSNNNINNNCTQSPLLGLGVDAGVVAKAEETGGIGEPGSDARVHITVVNKMPQILEFKLDHGGTDFGFEESDYSLLTTDLALTLLSSINELKELPHLDQQVLDQIFLAPPRLSVAPSPQRRAINLYGRRLDSLTAQLSPAVSGSICTPRLLASDSVTYSKMNVHYSTKISSTSPAPSGSSPSGMVVQHVRPSLSTSAMLPHKYLQRDSPSISPVRGVCCRKESSPMDMHSYSITMETMMQGGQKHVDTSLPKGIKLDPSVMSTQTKVSLQSLQLPAASRIYQKSKLHPPSKLHPRVVPVSCGFQQKFASQVFNSGSPGVLDKINPHHMCHMAPSTQSASPTAGSRPYPQSIGSLTAQSPLITSLSPLRNIKYSQAPYNPHCQMMPYRPRMQITAGTGGSGSRRTSHTIPLGTTMKSGVARGQSGGLHQIKVCLPTQSLKLPIANLRGPRKAPYVRDKLKNFGLPTNTLEPYSTLTSCSQFNIRSGTPTSLLAKVLNLHVKNEYAESNGGSVDPCLLSRPSSSAFIGTMRPVGSQPTSSCHRSGSQVQLISVVTSTGHSSELRSALSPQTAVVVSPLSVNRNSLASSSSDLLSTSTTYTSPTSVPTGQFFDLPSSIHSVTVQAKNSRPNMGKVISLESLPKTYERGFAPGLASKRSAGIEKEQVSQPTNCSDDEAAVEFIVVGTCTTEVEGSSCKPPLVDDGCFVKGHCDHFNEGQLDTSNTSDTNGAVTKTGESGLGFFNQDSDSVASGQTDSRSPDLYLQRRSPETSCVKNVRPDASNQKAASAVVGSKVDSTQYIIVQGPQHDLSTGTWRKLTVLEDSTAFSPGTESTIDPATDAVMQGGVDVDKRAPIEEKKGLVGSCPSPAKLNKDGVYDVLVVSEPCKGNTKSILGNKVLLRSSAPGPASKEVLVTGRKTESDDRVGKLGSRIKSSAVCSDRPDSSTLRERPGAKAWCPASESVTTKTAGVVAHVSSATTLVTFTMTGGSAAKDRPLRAAPQRDGQEAGAPVHEQASPATSQSKKRAHYVHEYLPT